jgi:hypothetical protein
VVNDLGNGPRYQNPSNRDADYGACDSDLRQSIVSSLVIMSPKYNDKWLNRLVGQWQLSPILSFHTGFPFTPTSGLDNSRTGGGSSDDRPNVVANPYVMNLNTQLWLQPSAFVQNPVGTFGNAGWNSLRGPRFFDLDVSLSRFFPIRESQGLQLRFEFFNSTNYVNFGNPVSNFNTATFGEILNAGNPRIIQLAAKYTF